MQNHENHNHSIPSYIISSSTFPLSPIQNAKKIMRMRNVFICLVTLCLFRATSSSSSSSSSINDRRNQLKRQRTSALLPPTAAVANRPLKSIKASRALQRDVEELVKACLRDPGINLIGVPDFLEKQVYRATIQLTLEALYNGLESIHGKELLGHVFVVQRRSRRRMRIQRDIARISDLADANDQVRHDFSCDVFSFIHSSPDVRTHALILYLHDCVLHDRC